MWGLKVGEEGVESGVGVEEEWGGLNEGWVTCGRCWEAYNLPPLQFRRSIMIG